GRDDAIFTKLYQQMAEANDRATKKGARRRPCRCSHDGPPRARPAFGIVLRLALGELEAAASLGLAVLLALDGAGVAGQEAALLEHAAQLRLEIGQRLGDAVTHRAGLARETTAGDRAHHVVLVLAGSRDEGLLDQHTQHGPRKIVLELAGIDDDLAGAGLDPDARDGVLALAGGIGAALLVHLLDVLGRFRRLRLQRRKLVEGLHGLGHDYAALMFLRFSAAMSSTSGCWASCGCSAPA